MLLNQQKKVQDWYRAPQVPVRGFGGEDDKYLDGKGESYVHPNSEERKREQRRDIQPELGG